MYSVTVTLWRSGGPNFGENLTVKSVDLMWANVLPFIASYVEKNDDRWQIQSVEVIMS